MAKRFTTRSTTPGAKRLTQVALAVVADYPSIADVRANVIFANGSLTGVLPVSGPTTPSAPTLSVVTGNDGVSAVATITSDAGVINQLFYKQQADAIWTAGATVTGPGTVQQTGLNPNVLYFFQVVSADPASGNFSLPSNLVSLSVAATATPIKDAIGAQIATLLQALVPASLSMVQRPVSGGMMASPQNLSCYILQGNLRAPEDDVQDSEGRNIVVTSIQPYDLSLFAVQSDSDATPVDSILNAMEAAVVGAVLNGDGTDNLGPELPTLVLGAVWFDPVVTYFRNTNNANIFGATKKLLVEFQHPQNSLFLLPS